MDIHLFPPAMSLLSTGTNALISFQRALHTTAHNLVNQNTKGYSRQSVSFATANGTNYSFGRIGNGVKIVDIHRDADALAISRLLDSHGELSRLQQLSSLTDRLDGLFSDKSTNIAGLWSNFFDAASAVAADASSNATRQQLLDSAKALETRFQQLDGQLGKMEEDVNARLRASADEINRLSKEIAELNGKIGSNAATAAPDVLDRRDQLVSELVGFTGGSTVIQDGGQINVLSAGGHALVVGATAATVTTVADPYQPGRLHLSMRSKGKDIRMDDKTFGGQIGGLFEFRRQALDQSRADLGRLAVGLAERFNTVHAKGVDLLGKPGGDFFTHASPRVGGHPGNTGTATLNARYGNLGELTGQNVQLHFDGTAWSARDPETGAAVALTGSGTVDDPLHVGGIELVVQGKPQKDDAFLLQPTAGVAGSLKVAITDPAKIAAASPVKVDDISSKHTKVSEISMTEGWRADQISSAKIHFTSPNEYTIDGAGPYTYDPNAPIVGNGWQIRLEGTPMENDSITIRPTGANSSDNSNARQLADVAAGNVFAGGTVSLNAAVSGMITRIGSTASAAEAATKAQELLHAQALSARDAVSGVNQNEEEANLIQLQQAIQTASQLISTADTLFQTILNVTRR